MAERIDVARGKAMIGDADEIERGFQSRNAVRARIIATHHDMVQSRRRILRTGSYGEVARATDALSGLDQFRCRRRTFGRQIVERAALVLLAEASPVGDLLEERF